MKGFSDYPAAYFPWAFRDGLYSIGLFREARTTHAFLAQIGQEIDAGCDSGRIDCRPRFTNLAPAWHSEWNPLAVRIFLKTLARITKFKGFVGNGPRVGSVNEDKLIVNYKYVTQSPVRPQSIELLRRVPEYQKRRIHERRFVFDKILNYIYIYIYIYEQYVYRMCFVRCGYCRRRFLLPGNSRSWICWTCHI